MAYIAKTLDLKDGQPLSLKGWVHRLRKLGDKVFIVLRNENGIIQAVSSENNISGDLGVESSIEVSGDIKKDERAPGGFELQNAVVKVVGESAPDWPFHRYKSTEMEMDNRHLWLRSTSMQSVLKVKQTVLQGAREWLTKEGFWEIHPPIFVSSACEGGSTLFEVPYFGDKAFLSQSGQLYAEAFLPSLGKVWALTPSFRAEKSRTRRHVTEYWHLEPEAAFVKHEENLKIQEKLLKHIIRKVLDERQDVMEDFGDRSELDSWVSEDWPRITYDEATGMLEKKFKVRRGDDIGVQEELFLTEKFDIPVFVTHYPRGIKSFYMKVDESNPKVVLNDDLLMPHVGEVVGGSEREWKTELLLENMKLAKLNPDDYRWYLDLRKYGSVPHSGFGLGVERFLVSLLKLDHIRDAIAFPRFINRVYP